MYIIFLEEIETIEKRLCVDMNKLSGITKRKFWVKTNCII